MRGYDPLAGTPAAGATVRVQLSHGPTVQTQTVTLDAEGAARVTFRNVALGMNLAEASTTLDGRDVRDVAAVTVALDAQGGGSTAGAGDLHISLDRTRYKPGDRVAVSANLRGALGDALITMETVRGAATTVAATANGSASATAQRSGDDRGGRGRRRLRARRRAGRPGRCRSPSMGRATSGCSR